MRQIFTSRRLLALGAGVLAVVLLGVARREGTNARQSVEPGAAVAAPAPASRRITAFGRIEPKDGIMRIAGPSQSAVSEVVIERLLVEKGDHVEAGQVVAVLDTRAELEAELAGLEANLDNAKREHARHDKLYREHAEADSERDQTLTRVRMLEAQVERSKAALAKASVRSPIAGRVVDVHAYAGERVGPDGIIEVASDAMYAIAEVYETDVQYVRLGQRATVTSPAFPAPLSGKVDRIGRKIGKLDALGVDPLAKIDARVVEVEVRLDDGERVAGLTNLQVEVAIEP